MHPEVSKLYARVNKLNVFSWLERKFTLDARIQAYWFVGYQTSINNHAEHVTNII